MAGHVKDPVGTEQAQIKSVYQSYNSGKTSDPKARRPPSTSSIKIFKVTVSGHKAGDKFLWNDQMIHTLLLSSPATAYVYNELQLYNAVNDVNITTISVESDIVRTSAYASLAITAPSASPSRSLLIIGGTAPSASCLQSRCTINGNGNQCFFSYGYTDVTLQNLRILNCNGTAVSLSSLISLSACDSWPDQPPMRRDCELLESL